MHSGGPRRQLGRQLYNHLRYHFFEASVLDIDKLRELVAGTQVVIHAAARNIIVSTRNPRDDFEANIGGTLNILLAARDVGVERIVYTSSASIYSNSRYLPVHEYDLPNLLSPYAVSKFAGESYCRAFYESYAVPTTVVRYFRKERQARKSRSEAHS
jgi:UDP-glucose 4-epimerase